jgi:hypothetical protein
MVVGTVGPRAGLCQLGGDLILIGRAGPLAGDRQAGGRLLTHSDLGPHAGRGRRGGRFIRIDTTTAADKGVLGDEDDRAAMGAAFDAFRPWLSAASP